MFARIGKIMPVAVTTISHMLGLTALLCDDAVRSRFIGSNTGLEDSTVALAKLTMREQEILFLRLFLLEYSDQE